MDTSSEIAAAAPPGSKGHGDGPLPPHSIALHALINRALGEEWAAPMQPRGSALMSLLALELPDVDRFEQTLRLTVLENQLRAGALSGDVIAAVALHAMYAQGYGVKKTRALAWAWILCAVQNSASCNNHSLVYLTRLVYDVCAADFGIRSQKDGKRLLRYFRKRFINKLGS